MQSANLWTPLRTLSHNRWHIIGGVGVLVRRLLNIRNESSPTLNHASRQPTLHRLRYPIFFSARHLKVYSSYTLMQHEGSSRYAHGSFYYDIFAISCTRLWFTFQLFSLHGLLIERNGMCEDLISSASLFCEYPPSLSFAGRSDTNVSGISYTVDNLVWRNTQNTVHVNMSVKTNQAWGDEK